MYPIRQLPELPELADIGLVSTLTFPLQLQSTLHITDHKTRIDRGRGVLCGKMTRQKLRRKRRKAAEKKGYRLSSRDGAVLTDEEPHKK